MEPISKHSLTKDVFTQLFCDPEKLIFKGQCYDAGASRPDCSICGSVMQYCYILKILGQASGACAPEVGKLRVGECCFHLIQTWNSDLYGDLTVARAYLRIVAKATERDCQLYGQLILLNTSITEEPAKLSGTYVGPVYPEAPMLRQPGQALFRIGLEKYRHPLYGWINERNMARQVDAEMAKLSDPEKAKVKAVIRVLQDNGALPADNPASRLFSK
jgi:hypothetical protein